MFQEARLGDVPIRELGLRIEGTPLAPLVEQVERELAAVLPHLHPRFYLSTEWGVPFETIAVAIPFYLARPELAELHAEQTGMVEGQHQDDILRYLRHELGHAVNYAYRLYERPDWVQRFGAITQPYLEEYRPEPWSMRHVRHLPGWYAQKHPDEDWAETFAVWLAPGDWRSEYAAWPEALAKLERCDAILGEIRDREPLVTDTELDEDVAEIDQPVHALYADAPAAPAPPPGLDGALRAIFEDLPQNGDNRPAAALIAGRARALARAVYTWTGHFPETTRALLFHMVSRADALGLTYPFAREDDALVALTALVTSLAMNHVHRGSYLP